MRNVILLFILILFTSCKKETVDVINEDLAPVIPKIIEHSITSRHVNDIYPIQVSLPDNEFDSNALPVIYVLDGVSRFEIVQELVLDLGINAIVVGIGNNEMRNRDYMPENTCVSDGGGHSNYYNFLVEELIPFIDGEYNTDKKNRTLVGHSFSGAMALIALFSENLNNPIINSYIANDPSILCEPDFFNGLLPDNDNFSNQTIKLHISKSYQNTYHLYDYGEKLESKKYNWLTLDWQEFVNENHSSIVRPSFKVGLQFIFN